MKKGQWWAISAFCALIAAHACPSQAQQTITINPETNVLLLDNSTSGFNNAISLAGSGTVSIQATGDASFGSIPGQVYDSVLIAYRDLNNRVQYAAASMNGPALDLVGSQFDFALLTDLAGQHIGNTGSATITESDAGGVIKSGTILAGSTTSAITGVAQLSSQNAVILNTPAEPRYYSFTASGDMFADEGVQYGSIVVQHRNATGGITYETLPLGQTQTFYGFNFRFYVTDFSGAVDDNTGSVSVVAVAVPEPAAMGLLSAALLAGIRMRRTGAA